jgi:hypothetical protein
MTTEELERDRGYWRLAYANLSDQLIAAETRITELEALLRDCQQWDLGGVGEKRLAIAETKVKTLREALHYVVGWIRHGEGDESTAAEMADDALAASEPA